MLKTRIATLASAFAAATAASVALAVPAQAAGTNYIALGDSYSSGVGAGSYTAESGDCERSYNAYPQLYANAHSPSYYRSVACSGATTQTVIDSQVPVLTSSTTLVSITVGGNDVGFSDIMYTCIMYGENECVAAVDRAEDKARNELPAKLDATYNAIRQHAPYASVVVLSYPVFYQLNVPYCVGLSETSRAKIDEGINLLDDITRDATVRHSFVFADVRSIFVGHQLCSGDKWLHSLNWADFSVSYHPNTDGQALGYYPVFNNASS